MCQSIRKTLENGIRAVNENKKKNSKNFYTIPFTLAGLNFLKSIPCDMYPVSASVRIMYLEFTIAF